MPVLHSGDITACRHGDVWQWCPGRRERPEEKLLKSTGCFSLPEPPMVGLQSPEAHKAVLNGCRQCEDRAVSGCIQQWVRREERGRLPSSASQCPVWEAFQLGTSDTCRNVLTAFVVSSLDADCRETSPKLLRLPKVCVHLNTKSGGKRVGRSLCQAQEEVAQDTGKALGKRRRSPPILHFFEGHCHTEPEQDDSSF